MRGRVLDLVWEHNPTLHAPARYRRACRYQAFVPDPISRIDFAIGAAVAGLISEADAAIRELNTVARPALQPLARLLLRTESIASSKVEGMQNDSAGCREGGSQDGDRHGGGVRGCGGDRQH